MNIDFKVVTCCNRIPTEPYYTVREFAKSLGEHEPLVLDERFGRWMGLGSKVKWLYKAIKNGELKTKFLIFCDCFDLVFAVKPETLLTQYYFNFNSPLVISSEKNCFPDDTKDEYDALNPPTSYKYLNSGMIVGETEAMLALLEAMKPEEIVDDYRMDNGQNFHTNDQFLYQQMFLKQPVKIALDYHQILCNTLHDVKVDELDFSEKKIRNIETGSYPCSFHLNGGAKTGGLREPILNHLNL